MYKQSFIFLREIRFNYRHTKYEKSEEDHRKGDENYE
jgi:hypothetical protein